MYYNIMDYTIQTVCVTSDKSDDLIPSELLTNIDFINKKKTIKILK